MQGDNTDIVLAEKLTDLFNENVQKQLTANSRYTTAEAFIHSLNLLTENVKKVNIDIDTFCAAGVMLVFICVHGYLMIFSGTISKKKQKEYQEYIKCPNTFMEIKCNYCGGIYAKGTANKCPYCGAPLSEEDKKIKNNIYLERIFWF